MGVEAEAREAECMRAGGRCRSRVRWEGEDGGARRGASGDTGVWG